jgi:hypothetical protein
MVALRREHGLSFLGLWVGEVHEDVVAGDLVIVAGERGRIVRERAGDEICRRGWTSCGVGRH